MNIAGRHPCGVVPKRKEIVQHVPSITYIRNLMIERLSVSSEEFEERVLKAAYDLEN